jgi:hypothetical protein
MHPHQHGIAARLHRSSAAVMLPARITAAKGFKLAEVHAAINAETALFEPHCVQHKY